MDELEIVKREELLSKHPYKIESPTVKDIFDEWIEKRLEHEGIEKSTHSRYRRIFETDFSKIRN